MHNTIFKNINNLLENTDENGRIVVSKSKKKLDSYNSLLKANKNPIITKKSDKILYLMMNMLRGFKFLQDIMARKKRINEIGLIYSEDETNISFSFDLFLMLGIEKVNVAEQIQELKTFFNEAEQLLIWHYRDFGCIYIDCEQEDLTLYFSERSKKNECAASMENSDLNQILIKNNTIKNLIISIQKELKRNE